MICCVDIVTFVFNICKSVVASVLVLLLIGLAYYSIFNKIKIPFHKQLPNCDACFPDQKAGISAVNKRITSFSSQEISFSVVSLI